MKGVLKRLFGHGQDKNKQYFLITSHGQTASMWLAAVLNNIPNVFCSHGYTYPPRPARLEEISSDDLYAREQSAQRFNTLTLPDFFSELRNATDKPIVGNILAFYLGRLFSKMSAEEIAAKKRSFILVNMIRHPLTRLTSTLKTWNPLDEDLAPEFVHIDFETRCQHYREFISRSHNVDLTTKRNKSFVVTLLAMEDIARDVQLATSHHIPNIKYEDITNDKNHFAEFIKYITDKRVKLRPAILDDLFQLKKINAHNKTGHRQAREQFQSWEKWQQDAFRFAMERTDMLKVYEGQGYDFSFVT